MKTYKVGIVGFGNVAGAHLDAFAQLPQYQPVAVLSRRELDSNAIQSRHGVRLQVYHDYDRFLQDSGVDVVDICTPHPLHPEQTIKAAEANKNLIIEKPLALCFEDALAMLDAVKKACVKTSVCFEVRFMSVSLALKSIIDRGLIGDIHYGECDYFHGIGPWYDQYRWNVKKEMGGSSLLTAGCHALDILLWLVGGDVKEVFSYGSRSSHEDFRPYEYDTCTITMLKWKDGKIGKVASVIDCQQPYFFNMNIVGSHGSLQNNRFYSKKIEGLKGWSRLDVDLVESGKVGHHPYRQQFAHFADCLDAGTEAMNNLESALETHRVIFAADRSAETGRPVSLKDFRR